MKLRLLTTVAALAIPLATVAVPTSVSAEGVVRLFHRSAAESLRTPRMKMFNYCAEVTGITIEENFVPPQQYEVQLPVQLSSSNPPDIYAFWAGGRAQFQVENGKIYNMNEAWNDSIKDKVSAGIQATSTEPDGNVYVIPSTFQPNLFWYNKQVFADNNIDVPESWDELMASAAILKEAGITPFIAGARDGWEPLFWFDYLILRTAGSDFRSRLMVGEESYLDERVVKAMEIWADMIEKGYFNTDFSSIGWQEMATGLMAGTSAMELMGPWTAGTYINAGKVPGVDFDAFPFPVLSEEAGDAVQGAVEGWAASGAGKNTEGAIEILKCVTSKEAQTEFAREAQRLPANKDVPIDVYLPVEIQPTMQLLTEMLSAPFHQNLELAAHPGITEVAKREMPRFMTYPDQMMDVLQALEDRRLDVHNK